MPSRGRKNGNASSGFLSVDELRTFRRGAPLIEGVLPEKALVVVYGEPKVGKTYFVLEWALSIASGHPHFGRRVRPGAVIYVAGEGVEDLDSRIRAWRGARGVGKKPRIEFEGTSLSLLRPRAVKDFCRKLRALETPPALVVVETLALSMEAGDENSAKDMGRTMVAAKQIRDEIGATVVLVHHSNKLGKVRGSSALAAAADMVVKVARGEANTIKVVCEMRRSDAPFPSMTLTLRSVDLGGSLDCVLDEVQPDQTDSDISPSSASSDEPLCTDQGRSRISASAYPNGGTGESSPPGRLQ